ncbi:MAG TPA: FAD-dependent oxidoreductase [Bacteroidales bacterium]|mgnify:FL=1|nr:FAD-dependent oxidoreductase [Bacteroidales bacterium]HPS15743.1 FAD-dependent oxidoreductase [Bacteroidales bacterium]
MHKIEKHPIISIEQHEKHVFQYNGKEIIGEKGFTIAAALHQAGFPIHSHSLANRERSLECGIGKCGACEMLVDGKIKRICITTCDEVKTVEEIPNGYVPKPTDYLSKDALKVYKTSVVIIGAGPAGLACREILNESKVSNIVVDSNAKIGGQFNMQTHQFFFFEKEKKYGGMRGFEIAKILAGDDHTGIFLDCTVWDIFENNRIAVKNMKTQEIFYIDCEYFVVAAGAVPFLPSFHNDDLPGVYTAAVIQKMMNTELTLLGKNILTVGAGNIGYLTSYQLTQAGAKVKAIVEALPHEGGFPVQANRVRRLGIPVILSHLIIEAIPNKNHDGITGAVIVEAKNFKPVPGTEKIIEGIDAINICTGLIPDNDLLIKGREMFGRKCFGAGDAIRIGEGTSAVLRGKQVAYEILDTMSKNYNYEAYLTVSKEYFDSQQHPEKIIEEPYMPSKERMEKPFVQIDCLYGFSCNPCAFACPHGAITKSSTSTVPQIDFEKCIGCMDCVYQCPGLAIFGYNLNKETLFLPVELDVKEGSDVFLVDNYANKIGEGKIDKILKKKNLTNIARVKSQGIPKEELVKVRGFVVKENYPEKLNLKSHKEKTDDEIYMCHCDDVTLADVMKVIGDRKYISIEEIKHTTHLGMGPCRGKRCLLRLRLLLRPKGVTLIGHPTPRAPLSNQITIGELYPTNKHEKVITNIHNQKPKVVEVKSFVAGGGIGGSSLFRYLAEEGKAPVLINFGFGSSWRNIAGGRPQFSLPELTDISRHNLELFKNLSKNHEIDFRLTNYITFAHDEEMLKTLEDSLAWQKGVMLKPNQFRTEISPYYNASNSKYLAALKTGDCWQATPGKVIEALRQIAISKGGTLLENCELIDVEKKDSVYKIIVKTNENEYIEYRTEIFINALGGNGDKFAKKLGIETGLYPVKHQAFITRRLPMLGLNGSSLDMLIDRRKYKGFIAVYGQQLADTGQIIGCASPQIEPGETGKDLKYNSENFIEIVSEIFTDWIPEISAVGFQALWSGYYTEPRMIIDTHLGLFLGLRGQGFMLGQYLGKMYVDKLMGRETPTYFKELEINGSALLEKAFK